jgi:uncharacterized protein (TIGR02271 family)
MDPTIHQWNLREGMAVFGADGDKVGKIQAVYPRYIVVEKGFFFPTDYYIPMSAIASTDGDRVYLAVSKDDALHRGWDAPPFDLEDSTDYPTMAQDDMVVDQAPAGKTESVRVPVHEERLGAQVRTEDAGSVRIHKDVVTEEQTISVPVRQEQVRVEWKEPTGAAPSETAFEEGTIEVPVRREVADVQKQTYQTGELEVTKEAGQRTEQVSDTVRREVVDVEDETSGAQLTGQGRDERERLRRDKGKTDSLMSPEEDRSMGESAP